jgi:hypothetical protein
MLIWNESVDHGFNRRILLDTFYLIPYNSSRFKLGRSPLETFLLKFSFILHSDSVLKNVAVQANLRSTPTLLVSPYSLYSRARHFEVYRVKPSMLDDSLRFEIANSICIHRQSRLERSKR